MNAAEEWLLLDPDPALEYQIRRDLLREPTASLEPLRQRIPEGGWAKALLDRRGASGHWGNGVYNPKWTCTHYVLYELAQLEVPADHEACRESAMLLLSHPRGRDGGINYAKTIEYSDVCVNGMILTISRHFGVGNDVAEEIIDFLLNVRMPDGGWNCEYFRNAERSSLHTTISVIEGLGAWLDEGHAYRAGEIAGALERGTEFILRHKLYKSERTGETIKDEFFTYRFPIRWKYDVLRCLDLFRRLGVPRDARMEEAIAIVSAAGGKTGRWKAASQPGKTYFIAEKNGMESRWNTLRALRVLRHYGARDTWSD